MLHELLVAMVGHPGDIFRHNQEFSISPAIELHISERLALSELSSLGFKYSIIHDFTEEFHMDIYKSTLSYSINSFLEAYRSLILELEPVILQKGSTIGQIKTKVDKYHSLFDDIITLINELTNINGIQIFNLINQKSTKTGDLTRKTLYKQYFEY
jgi:hypothetical protein